MRLVKRPDPQLWRITRWLVDPGMEVSTALRASLINGLYGTLPIFAGGVINTIGVAVVITLRFPEPAFFLWLALEMSLCFTRLCVLITARRRNFVGVDRLTNIYVVLGVLWAASVGYGTFISVTHGDWVTGALAWLSAAAMCGGICFRNFSAPRYVGIMILLSLGPCVAASVVSGEPILLITAFQIPFYLYAMTTAAFRLNRMLVSTMQAEQANDHLARHDPLTGLLNRVGLERQFEECGEAPNLTVFYLDLDGFKGVNDRLGHGIGDKMLEMVGERLQNLSKAGTIAARIGGDEFVMVTAGHDEDSAIALAVAAIDEIAAHPYILGEEAIEIGLSIGIAYAPDHGTTLPALLNAADNALYQAKARGRCNIATASTIKRPPPLRLATA